MDFLRGNRFSRGGICPVLLALVILAGPGSRSRALAQREGPVALIEDPRSYFTDDRQRWIGQRIRFLPCPNVEEKNPYFDWYYNPYDMAHSKPRKEDLLGRIGVFEEVYLGQVHIVKPERDYWRAGFFWKVRLVDDGSWIYFWDDGESGPFNFGFVADLEEARQHAGQKLWAKKRHVIYSLDGKRAILLKHLEQVLLEDVQWGDYGNFPLKFILSTQNGRKGYVLDTTYSHFIRDWYTYDPRERFRYVRLQDWVLIERQQLRMGMTPEMVVLSWGEPADIETRLTKDGTEEEIWRYEGVGETEYFIHFVNRKLISVRWQKKEQKNRK